MIAGIGALTSLSIKLWMPALPVTRKNNTRTELEFFKKPVAWLLILITSIGTGGLFCWISYIAPLMTGVAHFSPNTVPYILILAGIGMLVGNFIGGKLADTYPPATACMIGMLGIAICLIIDYFGASSQPVTLVMTFITGAVTFTLGTPLQILMIRTAGEAEMLGASASQAAFNIGNALGAFWGGLPIAAGYGYASPLLIGTLMALCGVFFTWFLIRQQRQLTLSA
jgi:DHA1 family arabinose polymer transporter-like MFS transporter